MKRFCKQIQFQNAFLRGREQTRAPHFDSFIHTILPSQARYFQLQSFELSPLSWDHEKNDTLVSTITATNNGIYSIESRRHGYDPYRALNCTIRLRANQQIFFVIFNRLKQCQNLVLFCEFVEGIECFCDRWVLFTLKLKIQSTRFGTTFWMLTVVVHSSGSAILGWFECPWAWFRRGVLWSSC